MTMLPGYCCAAASRRGRSAAACWPSPSIVSTPSAPSSSARRKPSCSALALPSGCSWRMRSTGRSAIAALVPSLEPSSTTMTRPQWASASCDDRADRALLVQRRDHDDSGECGGAGKAPKSPGGQGLAERDRIQFNQGEISSSRYSRGPACSASVCSSPRASATSSGRLRATGLSRMHSVQQRRFRRKLRRRASPCREAQRGAGAVPARRQYQRDSERRATGYDVGERSGGGQVVGDEQRPARLRSGPAGPPRTGRRRTS